MERCYLVGEIADNIGDVCSKWGRIAVTQTKEKYGTARVYCGFGVSSLHQLIFPRYVYRHRHYPEWLWKLDIDYLSRIVSFFNFIIIPYQHAIYRYAYWKYIKKYPDLFDEITSAMDWPEVLGWYIPKLCSDCSQNYNKTCYLAKEDECESCKK